ncbi:Asparaginyl-tRNA synthetase, cytoplasmic (Asparagine--tRNA ligase) (AsnRS) [Balamuthia mandrillaris]
MAQVLVVANSRTGVDFRDLLRGCTIGEEGQFLVEQSTWQDLSIDEALTGITGVTFFLQGSQKRFTPDYVFFFEDREFKWSLADLQHRKTIIYALLYANIPTCNNLNAFYSMLDDAVIYGKLAELKTKNGGKKQFPLVPKYFYPYHNATTFMPPLPMMVKTGTAANVATRPKMKISTKREWDHFLQSEVAKHKSFLSSEPFVESDFVVSVQKIGSQYKCLKYNATINEQERGEGASVPLDERWKKWIDMVALELNLRVCFLDLLHSREVDSFKILKCGTGVIGLNSSKHCPDVRKMLRALMMEELEQALLGAERIVQKEEEERKQYELQEKKKIKEEFLRKEKEMEEKEKAKQSSSSIATIKKEKKDKKAQKKGGKKSKKREIKQKQAAEVEEEIAKLRAQLMAVQEEATTPRSE